MKFFKKILNIFSHVHKKGTRLGRVDENLMVKLLELIPEKNINEYQLCCKTGIDHRTIKKYIQLIIYVQNSPKLKMETIGLRVFVRKEKQTKRFLKG